MGHGRVDALLERIGDRTAPLDPDAGTTARQYGGGTMRSAGETAGGSA